MTTTKIEWTEMSWNPLTGCDKISTGCSNCYAERMAKRLQAMGQKNYHNGFKITLHEDALSIPLKWKKPAMIFVNSMSDLFHEDVPFSFIRKVFSIMTQAQWHTFQLLTKRSSRLAKLSDQLKWPKNTWMGVSVENADFTYRISNLVSTGAAVKFLSLEPLLGPIPDLDLTEIDWVIVGGESGPGARPMESQWVVDIRDQCKKSDTPFFFKQWGGTNKKKSGRLLDGRTWSEMPPSNVLC
jgi:protein gp37